MGLEDLQALVLDEADRLLEMGFAEEVCTFISTRTIEATKDQRRQNMSRLPFYKALVHNLSVWLAAGPPFCGGCSDFMSAVPHRLCLMCMLITWVVPAWKLDRLDMRHLCSGANTSNVTNE